MPHIASTDANKPFYVYLRFIGIFYKIQDNTKQYDTGIIYHNQAIISSKQKCISPHFKGSISLFCKIPVGRVSISLTGQVLCRCGTAGVSKNHPKSKSDQREQKQSSRRNPSPNATNGSKKYSAFLKGDRGCRGGRGNLFSREKRFPLPPLHPLSPFKKAEYFLLPLVALGLGLRRDDCFCSRWSLLDLG